MFMYETTGILFVQEAFSGIGYQDTLKSLINYQDVLINWLMLRQ